MKGFGASDVRLPAFEDLSKEQDLIYNLDLDGNHLVTGPPGTGKSIMALYRAQVLSFDEREPAVLMYNNVLQQYTKQAAEQVSILMDGELTAHEVDAALDIAGSGVIPELIELTGDANKVLSIADFTAPRYGAQVSTGEVDKASALAEVARLAAAGQFSIPVARAFPLAEAAQAQAASADGHVAGRFVVVP